MEKALQWGWWQKRRAKMHPPQTYVRVLTPRTCQWDLSWEEGLCRCSQNKVIPDRGGPQTQWLKGAWCPCKNTTWRHRHTKGHVMLGAEAASTGQGTPRMASNHQKIRERNRLPHTCGGNQASWHPGCGLQASGTVRALTPAVSVRRVCGHLLQQP